jgi:hypothetical protein
MSVRSGLIAKSAILSGPTAPTTSAGEAPMASIFLETRTYRARSGRGCMLEP